MRWRRGRSNFPGGNSNGTFTPLDLLQTIARNPSVNHISRLASYRFRKYSAHRASLLVPSTSASSHYSSTRLARHSPPPLAPVKHHSSGGSEDVLRLQSPQQSSQPVITNQFFRVSDAKLGSPPTLPATTDASQEAHTSHTESFRGGSRPASHPLPKKTAAKAEAVSTNTIWRQDEGGDYVFMLEERPGFGEKRSNIKKEMVIKAKDVDKIFSKRDGVLVVDTDALRKEINKDKGLLSGKPSPKVRNLISVSALVGKVPEVVAK